MKFKPLYASLKESDLWPKKVLILAHAEYKRQGHRQSLDEIQRRGGFSDREIACLLADHTLRMIQFGEDAG